MTPATSDTSSPSRSETQPGISTASLCQSSSLSGAVTTTEAATTARPRLSTSPVTAPTAPSPPSSRPPTLPTPTGTDSNTVAAPLEPANEPLAQPKDRLSHISIATWTGVGLALAGVVITVYYGIPMMRLAACTANNDFRETCKSELVAALPQTTACNKTLALQPLPPPIRKRTVSDMQGYSVWNSRPIPIATFCSTILLVWRSLEYMHQCNRTNVPAKIEKQDCSVPSPYPGLPLVRSRAILEKARLTLRAKKAHVIAIILRRGRAHKPRTLIDTASTLILLIPPMLVLSGSLKEDQVSPHEALAILEVFTLVHAAVMSRLTRASWLDLFAASAAYCGVLLIFVTYFGNVALTEAQ